MPTEDLHPATDDDCSSPLEPAGLTSWLIVSVGTVMAYLLVSHGLFVVAVPWQVALFVGAIAGLAASSALQGAIVSGLVVVVALAVVPPSATAGPLGPAMWVLGVVFAVGVALGVGVMREHHAPQRTLDPWLSAGLVVWLVLALWAPLVSTGMPPSGYGPLRAATIRSVPQPGDYVNDDALYLRIYYLVHHGESYYRAFRDAWTGLAGAPAPPSSVASVRLPTLYWVWRMLPADPFSIVYLYLAFASIGVVAAAWIAAQLAGSRFAPLAAGALAAYAMGSAQTVYVTYVDLPATCVALLGVALFLRARVGRDARFLWAAAVVMAVASLTREILVYLVVLALLASLLEPAEKRIRKAIPWFVALGIFALGYAGHAAAVHGLLVEDSSGITYLKGNPAWAVDSFRRFTDVMTGNGYLLLALFLLALSAAVGSRRRAGTVFATFATAALVVPVITMLKVGNPAIDASGFQVNYWGNLFMPLALALWPAWFLLLPARKAVTK